MHTDEVLNGAFSGPHLLHLSNARVRGHKLWEACVFVPPAPLLLYPQSPSSGHVQGWVLALQGRLLPFQVCNLGFSPLSKRWIMILPGCGLARGLPMLKPPEQLLPPAQPRP